MPPVEPDNDASRDSSPADTGAQAETSPNSPTEVQDSSPENGASSETSELDQLLEREQTETEQETSPVTEAAEQEAEGDEPAAQDEPGENEPKAGQEQVLSQEQERVFNKRFTERPEWQQALKLAGPKGEKEMRKVFRGIFARENAMADQVEKLKPAGANLERIRKAVGDEGVENSIRLIEDWNRGGPEAERMLQDLLSDLQARRGSKLVSPDLVKRSEKLSADVEAGLLDEAEAEQERKLLLELEAGRSGKKQTEAAQQQRTAAEAEARQTKLVNERQKAVSDWESNILKTDPDYPHMQEGVMNRALVLVEQKQQQKKSLLTPGEMVEAVKEAYAAEKAYLGKLQPKKPVRTPITGRGSSVNSSRKPQTDEEKLQELLDRER